MRSPHRDLIPGYSRYLHFLAVLWGPVGLILSTPLTVGLILLGRYVPQLEFLEVILGDEPVLEPEAHYYQRLLALDQEEANNVAHSHLKEKPLGSLYDSVLIPALSLAEQDRHMDALDEAREKFIVQGVHVTPWMKRAKSLSSKAPGN